MWENGSGANATMSGSEKPFAARCAERRLPPDRVSRWRHWPFTSNSPRLAMFGDVINKELLTFGGENGESGIVHNRHHYHERTKRTLGEGGSERTTTGVLFFIMTK